MLNVVFSVKMILKCAKSKSKLLAHQLRGQFPKPMPETSGEGAGIFVTHFHSHLHDGVLRAAFQQAAG